jgi:lysophospholipase L1-like esterase
MSRFRVPGRSAIFTALLLVLPLIFTAVAETSLRRLLAGRLDLLRRLLTSEVPVHLAIFRSSDGLFGVAPHPHQADPRLCWRNVANNAREPYRSDAHGIFSPHEVPYEHSDGRYRLLVLGDSSTAGLGLERQADSWPQILERRLQPAVEVVNGATIGYSTEQGLRFLRQRGRRYRPDAIAIYLGNNDPVGSSMTDRELLDSLTAPRSPVAALDGWLVNHSVSYLLLKLGARYLLAGDGNVVSAARTRRVPLPAFGENVRAMVRWASARSVDVYLITPPTPLEYPPKILEYNIRATHDPAWVRRDACLDAGEDPRQLAPALLATETTAGRYPKPDVPIARYARGTLGCFDGRLAEQESQLRRAGGLGSAPAVVYNNLAYARALSGNDGEALDLVLRAIEKEPAAPEFHYNAGILHRRAGNAEAAIGHLQRAVDLDLGGVKIQTDYLEALRSIASSQPSVSLVDANREFRARGNEHLFSDHVHPNEEGQRLTAELVASAILRRRSVAGAPLRGDANGDVTSRNRAGASRRTP